MLLAAAKILKSIRDLFRGDDHGMQAVDGTEIVLEALNVMREELKYHEIITQTELTPRPTADHGYKVQLRQVILNFAPQCYRSTG
jgi:C4-dicarboxylate-specific signal transduction histidine kinase